MAATSKTINVLDLGSWAVKLLRIRFKNNSLIDCEFLERPHQTSVQNRLDFNQNYLNHLPASLQHITEVSGLSGPVDVLLPASFFEYKISPNTLGHLQIKLDEGIRQNINRILEKYGLEASFLGSGLAAEIETLRNSKPCEPIFLLSMNYSASFFIGLMNGVVTTFSQLNSVSGLELDKLLDDGLKIDGCNQKILSWKKDQIILLPVYREIQQRIENFKVLLPFLNHLMACLDQCENSVAPSTVWLSGGVSRLRNLEAYLEGTRTNEYQSFCTSFFSEWLENTSLGSDNQNGWASCLAHAQLINDREIKNAKSDQRLSI